MEIWFLEGQIDFFKDKYHVLILELHDISPLIYASRFFRMNTVFISSQTRLRASGTVLWEWRVQNVGMLQIMTVFAVSKMCSCSKSPDT